MLTSCIDLTETNENPTEITDVGGYLLLSNVLSGTARLYHSENFSGVRIVTAVQYIQVLNNSEVCRYRWNSVDWGGYYDLLRNNQEMIENAAAEGNNFYAGAGLVMKSFLFGYLTDLFGDCPYSEALKGNEGNYAPVYDKQEDILNGLLKDLEEANMELSKSKPAYSAAEGVYDIAYHGDIARWRKLANSLALRYYMRLSAKLPDKAKAGIEKIMGDPNTYPVFESNNDSPVIAYPGANQWDSWSGGLLNWANGYDFRRRRPCNTFINVLKELNDPRISVWFTPVEIQITVEKPPYTYDNPDTVVGSKRYVHDNAPVMDNGTAYYDTSLYVGLRYNLIEPERFEFNLTKMGDDGINPSLSYLAPRYQQNTDELVNALLMDYPEVCFILSEAAFRGWNVGGNAESYYNKGVAASLAYYKVDQDYGSYILQDRAKYNGTLARIIEQKWISLFLSPESWFDFRRTGLPALPVDPDRALHPEIPVRYKYPTSEVRNNTAHYNEAAERLEKTPYSDSGNDDPYSKPWILQGTGKPW
jgi:hypothetical protein